jgi:aminoglycoside phosphotransferase (APT) family kinase protein
LSKPYALRDLSERQDLRKFNDGVPPGLPTQDQLIKWYAEMAGWDPSPDIPFGNAFGFFKATVVSQGIAARYAVRQASSAQEKHNQKSHQILRHSFGTQGYRWNKALEVRVGI